MVRRTVSLPPAVDEIVREVAREGESYSSALTRLIEAGARVLRSRARPRWIGAGRGGPADLALRAEYYLTKSLRGR